MRDWRVQIYPLEETREGWPNYNLQVSQTTGWCQQNISSSQDAITTGHEQILVKVCWSYVLAFKGSGGCNRLK